MPYVAKYDCFALKGGTALNLFIRDFPRLSVDIDLVFLPMMERDDALTSIKTNLNTLASSIETTLPVRVVRAFQEKADALRLLVERNGIQIKIELSPVLRGTVYEPKIHSVSEAVEAEFGYAEMAVVSFADLYAGKICAALDRQHPRDLFDVKQLLDNEGIDEPLRKALLVYMISHPRPIAEILRPNFKDISGLYDGEFKTMSEQEVSRAELESARVQLVDNNHSLLTLQERQFLLSSKRLQPDWSLLGIEGIDQLPAVRWKMHNLSKMSAIKHAEACNRLSSNLGLA
ncbi:nucleotidyl transferase AbiEii/AbiGii toxin family protein [Rheinheimera sp. UJ51]|uniref:nucleotidyl transferase AbiEii/AbiGii toxin family protein n=1 Tax=Rheinheimera sp. UJ51 TaxID=2892446 RepID=UPI002D1FB423|nr:nucleotidyl transferase AbiEii/AbiGii toxin family protein [Rheinheimera sp. UJ51]MCC5452914.1 nucleotidyl transferase AbiEii/AbiGii toxin family protein [Rheinheimera sp. UJ51]